MGYTIGIDTGGTFTDVVVIGGKGAVTTGKALSTPPTFTEGIMNGLENTARSLRTSVDGLLRETDVFVLGTTIATNTIINRSGAKTGLVATVGHEHVHHIARGGLSKWAGLSESETREAYRTKKVEPLLPKALAKGVVERVDWKGSVVCPLNIEDAKQAIGSLVQQGVESIAVCLLWSFSNPAHEKELGKILSEEYPNIYSSISHELAPSLGEYARANTTIIDGYIGPETTRFLTSLDKFLSGKGLKHPMLVMQAHGGCVVGREARPFTTFSSGPAAGVIASKYLGELLGHENIITTDVGGTSFDISLIVKGLLTYAREPVVARFPVAFPMVDVISIGAGGGSIAWIDPLTGLLRVGPRSAGAYPGPACYGFGGIEATVTDADLVLGYLNPDYFLGGTMKLHSDRARDAIKKLADSLGWDVTTTAAGIYDIVNAKMADLVRSATIERGYNPSEFALFAYGGNGPMHAAVYAGELGVSSIVIPSVASTFSAFGSATSDILHSHRMFRFSPMPMDADSFNQNFQALEGMVNKELEADGIKKDDRVFNYAVDMRYGAQYYALRMAIERKNYDAEAMEGLCRQFDDLYESLYGKGSEYTLLSGRFVTSFMVDGIGKIPKPVLSKHDLRSPDASQAVKEKREVFFRAYNTYRPTDIYDYAQLRAGNMILGPAIIEAVQTTIVIPPGRQATVDEYLNVIIK
ncbi:MAG TPA: hydantoinase/oxoprolinase family protein [Syntrophorhabdales bacterium]|nr:hydantoinase/oxoprolinase family protein [Syntrophorhabdales bacterium]